MVFSIYIQTMKETFRNSSANIETVWLKKFPLNLYHLQILYNCIYGYFTHISL